MCLAKAWRARCETIVNQLQEYKSGGAKTFRNHGIHVAEIRCTSCGSALSPILTSIETCSLERCSDHQMRLENQDPYPRQPRFCNAWIIEADTLQDIDVYVAKLLPTCCRVFIRIVTGSTSHHKTNQETRLVARTLQNLGVTCAKQLQTRCKTSRQMQFETLANMLQGLG